MEERHGEDDGSLRTEEGKGTVGEGWKGCDQDR